MKRIRSIRLHEEDMVAEAEYSSVKEEFRGRQLGEEPVVEKVFTPGKPRGRV